MHSTSAALSLLQWLACSSQQARLWSLLLSHPRIVYSMVIKTADPSSRQILFPGFGPAVHFMPPGLSDNGFPSAAIASTLAWLSVPSSAFVPHKLCPNSHSAVLPRPDQSLPKQAPNFWDSSRIQLLAMLDPFYSRPSVACLVLSLPLSSLTQAVALPPLFHIFSDCSPSQSRNI